MVGRIGEFIVSYSVQTRIDLAKKTGKSILFPLTPGERDGNGIFGA